MCIKMQDLVELSLTGKAMFDHRHVSQVPSFMAAWGVGDIPGKGSEDCP